METIQTSRTVGDHAFISLALDSTNVYAADILGNTVVRIPLSSGAATPLALEVTMPVELSVASGFVYFTSSIDRSIRRLSVSGTSSQTSELVLPANAGTFAVHSGHVYYSSASGIYRVGVAGGSSIQLIAATNLSVPGMAVDDSGVYYTESGAENSDIKRAPLAGGAAETIFDGEPVVSDIALDSSAVYFASKPSSGAGLVTKLAK